MGLTLLHDRTARMDELHIAMQLMLQICLGMSKDQVTWHIGLHLANAVVRCSQQTHLLWAVFMHIKECDRRCERWKLQQSLALVAAYLRCSH